MAGEEELVLFPADSCEENTLLDDVDLPADLVFLMGMYLFIIFDVNQENHH